LTDLFSDIVDLLLSFLVHGLNGEIMLTTIDVILAVYIFVPRNELFLGFGGVIRNTTISCFGHSNTLG